MGSGGGGGYDGYLRDQARKEQQKRIAQAKALEAPDMTDEVIRAAQRSEGLRMTTGRTRASSFMTGGKTLLGG